MREPKIPSDKSRRNSDSTIRDAQREPQGDSKTIPRTNREIPVGAAHDEQTELQIHIGTAIL